MEFQQIIAMLICISLKIKTFGMDRQLVMIRESNHVISQSCICLQHLVWPEITFIQKPVHASMSVEISPLPAIQTIDILVRIIDVRARKCMYFTKKIGYNSRCVSLRNFKICNKYFYQC